MGFSLGGGVRTLGKTIARGASIGTKALGKGIQVGGRIFNAAEKIVDNSVVGGLLNSNPIGSAIYRGIKAGDAVLDRANAARKVVGKVGNLGSSLVQSQSPENIGKTIQNSVELFRDQRNKARDLPRAAGELRRMFGTPGPNDVSSLSGAGAF
jgi:hypothetical protein